MGRVLGIDFGTRRLGVALSDSTRRLASPWGVQERAAPRDDARRLRRLVDEEQVDLLVVGLPIHHNGRMNPSARRARDWAVEVAEALGLELRFVEERYTSVEAEQQLQAAGVRRAKRTGRRDMLAAQMLLQDFLDRGCPLVDDRLVDLDDPSLNPRVPSDPDPTADAEIDSDSGSEPGRADRPTPPPDLDEDPRP